MRNKWLLFLAAAMIANFCLGQQLPAKINAVLYNCSDSSLVPFAHIYVTKNGVGTTSNEAGFFRVHLDSLTANDTIKISCIGFENYDLVLKDAVKYSDTDTMRICLVQSSLLLKEIEIYANRDSVANMVYASFASINKNYPTKPYQSEVFYREVSFNKTQYLRLVEAVLHVTDFGINKKLDRTRIRADQVRKSEDMRYYSTLTKILEKMLGEKNDVYDLLVNKDLLKRYNNKEAEFFRSKGFKEATFRVNNVFDSNGDTIYVVECLRSLNDKTRQIWGRDILIAKLYINKRDLAFTRIEYYNSGVVIVGGTYKKLIIGSVVVWEYKKIDGKYYPFYAERNGVHSLTNLNGEDDEREQHVAQFVRTITDKKEQERIKKRLAERSDQDFYKKQHNYDSVFWANYTYPILPPLHQKLKTEWLSEQ